jgi:hypothetical protein
LWFFLNRAASFWLFTADLLTTLRAPVTIHSTLASGVRFLWITMPPTPFHLIVSEKDVCVCACAQRKNNLYLLEETQTIGHVSAMWTY